MSLFCVEVMADFLLKMLYDLRLPDTEFFWGRQEGAVDPHTKGERMLVLSRERNQIFIAQHALIMTSECVARGTGSRWVSSTNVRQEILPGGGKEREHGSFESLARRLAHSG